MALTFNAIQRGAAFERAQAFPLDKWSYFESYNLAVAAAATAAVAGTDDASNTVYFVGQTLVVNEGPKATLYIIQPDKTLKEVGAVPVGDGKSIEVVNGEIKLNGFGDGYYEYNVNYVPGSTEEGKKDQYVYVEGSFKAGLEPKVVATENGYEIAWYEPNPTTVEGLQSQITTLNNTVSTLTSTVGTKANASDVAATVSGLEASIGANASAIATNVSAIAANASAIAANASAISTNKQAADLVEGRVSVVEGKVSTLEGKVSTLESTYATASALDSAVSAINSTISGVVAGLSVYETIENVNAKVSAINSTISGVDAKFSGYYTKGEIDGKVSTINGEISTINGLISDINEEISGIVEDLADYAKTSYVDAEISRVVEVAQGKTQTFVVNYADNEFLNSQEAELDVQQFVTIEGKTIAADTLKPGDVILVVETNVPDRWVKQINEQGDFTLAKLETTKVDLAPYATTSYVDAEISSVMGEISSIMSDMGDLEEALASRDTALENRISVLEAKPFDTYASISYVDEKVAAEASARVSKDNELDAAIKAEVSRATGVEASLDAAIKAEVSARISADEALDAKISAEISRATGIEASLRTDVDHLLSQAVLSVQPTDNLHLSIDGNVLTASVLVSHLELNEQGNLASWANTVDSTLSNHASRLSVLEAKPFDTYASISYVEGEVSKLDAAIKAEASARASADASLATRLELVEDSLGLGGEGTHGGVAEQIATIVGEIWGANASAENLAEASSRIDDIDGRVVAVEDKVKNTLATKEYVSEQIQSAEHVISVKTDDTHFFNITKDQDDIVTINVVDDIENIINAAVTSVVSGGAYVSASTSGHGLYIDDTNLVSAINGINSAIASNASAIGSMASNPVVSIAMDGNQLSVAYHNGDASAFNLVEGVFGVSSIASNAVYLVSSETKVSTLNELTDGIANYGMSAMDVVYATQSHIMLSAANVGTTDIINTVQKAVTSVQTSTLVVSHSGNNLMINLPSVIWLDGGNAADSYDAEEALYDELLNNEYGE